MPCLLGSLFLACSLWRIVSSKDIQPSCLTDYDSEVVCHWKVNASTNCSKEFRLRVTTTHVFSQAGPSWTCSPKKRGPDTNPECACNNQSKVLRYHQYHFSLEANGEKIWKKSLDLDEIVKPRALVNLTVTRKEDSYILTWSDDYKEGHILHENSQAEYEIAYWPINQTDKVLKSRTTNLRYKIFNDNLTPRTIYVARVRHKIGWWGKRGEHWSSWSSWSTECKWKHETETEPRSDYILWISIPLLCVFIMALATISFFCFIRVKKGWWDQIPNPTKSKVAAGVAAAVVAPFGNVGLEHHVHIDSLSASAKPEARKEEECQDPHEDAVAKLFRDLLSGDLSSGGPSMVDELCFLKEQAPAHMQSAFSFSPEAPSKPVYHNFSVQPGNAAQELPLSHSLFSPEAQPITTDRLCLQGGGGSTAAPQASGYRCFSSLVAEPVAGFSQACEEGQEFSPFWDQTQPFSHDAGPGLAPVTSSLHPAFQGVFPADQDSLWFSSCMAAEEQEGRPGCPSQHVPGKSDPCPAASLLPGYRSFSSAIREAQSPRTRVAALAAP